MKAVTGAAATPGAAMAATATSTRRLVSLPEAAEILGLSVKTVRRYIAAGDLDAVRLGRRTIRIKTDSLDRLIDANPVNAWRSPAV
jgi:excisionase family DNA binding protein